MILVDVTGAEREERRPRHREGVADSLLVKTAVFGGDPNPGRILQAIGSSGVQFLPQLVEVSIGDVRVILGGGRS